MTGADRQKFKSDLLAIAAAADTGGETHSPAEGEAAPGSEGQPGNGAQQRRQKAAAAAAPEAAQQAQRKSPAHAARFASIGKAATEAQAKEAQLPPKKRSCISVSLPAGGDQAGSPVQLQNSSAAAEATADAKPGRGAGDHTRWRASRRSSQEAMEAARHIDVASEDVSPAQH